MEWEQDKAKRDGTEKKKMAWPLLQDDTVASDSRLGFAIIYLCGPGHSAHPCWASVAFSVQCEN